MNYNTVSNKEFVEKKLCVTEKLKEEEYNNSSTDSDTGSEGSDTSCNYESEENALDGMYPQLGMEVNEAHEKLRLLFSLYKKKATVIEAMNMLCDLKYKIIANRNKELKIFKQQIVLPQIVLPYFYKHDKNL